MEDINPYEAPRVASFAGNEPDPLFEIACKAAEGTRYPADAFIYLIQGIRFSERHIRHERQNSGSVDAVDLSWCLHDFAVYRFAEAARTQLESWNIRQTSDFRHMVFRLVEIGEMRTDEGDSIIDFENIFDFSEAFKIEDFQSTILFDEDI